MTDTDPDPPKLKPCTRCGVIQPLDNFDSYFRRRENRREPRSWCKSCMSQDAKERYRRKHPVTRRYRDLDGETHRTCRTCGETKPLEQFHRSGGGRLDQNGTRIYRRRVCGACANAAVTEYKRQQRQQDPEAAATENREKARKYRTQHGDRYRAYQKEYHKEWAARNRDKIRANRKRYDAKRRERKRDEHQGLSAVPPQSPPGGISPGCPQETGPEV